MPDFKYTAVLKDGKKIRGVAPSQSKTELFEKLKKSNVTPIKIKRIESKGVRKLTDKDRLKVSRAQKKRDDDVNKVKKYEGGFRLGMSMGQLLKAEVHLFSRVSDKDIISFMNNLYILKKAQFNNIQALKSLYETTESAAFRDVIEAILEGVENGERMHTMMAQFPNVFQPMVVSFIRVGEETGTLDSALLYARDYVENSQQFTKKVKAAVIPKVLQFVGIMALMVIAVIYGVPILKDVYAMFGSDKQIPQTTQMAVDIVDWFASNWVPIAMILVVLIGLFEIYIHTAKGRYNWDKFKFNFPVIGRLLTNMTVSNFFQAMLLNLKNGMRIEEALSVSKGVSRNYYFLSVVEIAKNRSLAGDSWITPFEERKIFNPMVVEMLSIGMQTDLPEMMEKVNSYIEIQIQDSVDKFVRWLPDITYAIVGVVLIVFCLVVLVPVVEVYMGSFIQY